MKRVAQSRGKEPKLAIVAGGGVVPILLAQDCIAKNRPFCLFGVVGAASQAIAQFPHHWINIGTIGKTMQLLRHEGCDEIVFIGPVNRPDLRKLRLDMRAVRLLPRYLKAARGGDDQLLRFMVDLFETEGFRIIGAHEVADGLAADTGVLGKISPDAAAMQDIARAAEVIDLLGKLDIGQGAVVNNGVVLAVEAAEGTDAMLHRCASLPPHLRGSGEQRAGVLVKKPKPGQERRVDLPTIGLSTVQNASAAGLAGIAVDAGGALIVDREAVIAEADRQNMFLYGIPPAVDGADGGNSQ